MEEEDTTRGRRKCTASDGHYEASYKDKFGVLEEKLGRRQRILILICGVANESNEAVVHANLLFYKSLQKRWKHLRTVC
jgi:hypothetical protein